MSRDDPQMKLRLPETMHARLKAEAEANKRSMNSEILARLARSLNETRVAKADVSHPMSQQDEDLMIRSREAASAAMTIGLHGYLMAVRWLELKDYDNVRQMLTLMLSALDAAMRSGDTYKSLQDLRNDIVHIENKIIANLNEDNIEYKSYADFIANHPVTEKNSEK